MISGIIILIVLFYFRLNIWNGFSYIAHLVFQPVLVLGNRAGEKFANLQIYFVSKNSLYAENENLKSQILESQNDRANYASVVAENASLKEILGRKDPRITVILAAILSKPNQSIYDTLLIDAGTNQGIKGGEKVFASENIPIGRVAVVYLNSSKVILFSSPGEKTQAIIPDKNIFLELIGRSGGNFEMILPRDITLQKGDQVTMPGVNPYILAIAETTISDPRDPLNKALLRSPVNIQELKFVEVEQ